MKDIKTTLKEFDEKFPATKFITDKAHKDVKEFLIEALQTQKVSLIKELEGMKVEIPKMPYVVDGMNPEHVSIARNYRVQYTKYDLSESVNFALDQAIKKLTNK